VVGDVGGDIKGGLRNPLGYGGSLALQRGQGVASGVADWSLALTLPSLKGVFPFCSGQSLVSFGALSSPNPISNSLSLEALRNRFLYDLALGSLSLTLGSNTENSFSRNSLLYKSTGITGSWRSASGRLTVTAECMKREEEPPAVALTPTSTTESQRGVGSGGIPVQINRAVEALQESLGRRRSLPYVSILNPNPSVWSSHCVSHGPLIIYFDCCVCVCVCVLPVVDSV